MLRLLIFVDPKPLPEHLFRNQSWLTLPLQLAGYLHRDAPSEFQISVALPGRFSHFVEPYRSMVGDRVYPVDETTIVRQIHRSGRTIRQAWSDDFLHQTPDLLRQEIDGLVRQSLPDEDWDVVLSFGEPCRYSFAGEAIRLNMETSSFGRYPFNFSFFLDHHGLFRESGLVRFLGGGEVGSFSDLTTRVRQQAWDRIVQSRKLSFFRRWPRYLLLPLQASNYASFDAQGFYQTQLDYLFDVCSQVPADTGVLLTEHPQISSVDFERNFSDTLQGLSHSFPQVTYLPRAKFFSSASLCLLPQVDAVWTLASNVGPVASFLGVPTGTAADSHLRYGADAHSVAELLCRPVGEWNRSIASSQFSGCPEVPIVESVAGASGWVGKKVFDWMFQHYLIPWQVAARPNWFASYLRKRLEAVKEAPDSLAGYPCTQLEAADFLDAGSRRTADSSLENLPKASRNFAVSGQLQGQVSNFRARQSWEARQQNASGDLQTFLLLNDTARLETYRHLGCNLVQRTLQSQMQQRGFRLLQAVNESAELDRELPPPAWVLINGEGSFHHNSPRIGELIGLALEFQTRGSRIALLNSIWESNDEALAEPLRQFDLVAVRDGRSAQALRQAGVVALRVPDLSLSAWISNPRSGSERETGAYLFTDNIVYHKALGMFDAMLALGGGYVLLDDRQIVRMDEDGCFSCLPEGHPKVQLLTNTTPIEAARLVICGRFHVAMACLALGKPFVYVESNTQKISALCQDVGLPIPLLNITAEIEAADWQALRFRLLEVEAAFAHFQDPIQRYCRQGIADTAALFDRFLDSAGLI
jgi:hypothetical protein